MSYRVGVKPGKAASAIGMFAGCLFVVLGVTVIVPIFGIFGMVWTAIAAAIAVFYAYNFFSATGASTYEVDVESQGDVEDLDAGLRKLAKLKEDGLLTDQEYEQKRAEIMGRQ
jgi:Short C-terminal domain